jgi:hypothetical protein
MATIAGLGRQLTNYLPNTQLFDPNPRVIPERTSNLTPRSIGEFFLPQSPLDVGLMMVPGGKAGKPVGKAAKQFLRRKDYGEAELVPAIKKIEGGEILPGILGKDVWHMDVMKRHGFPNNPSINRDKIVEGFVDSSTGAWLDLEAAAQLGTVRRATKKMSRLEEEAALRVEKLKRGSVPAQAARPKPTVSVAERQAQLRKSFPGLPEGKDPVVPAIFDRETGQWFVGKPGVDWMHKQVEDAVVKGRKKAGFRGIGPIDDGWQNLRTGEFFKRSVFESGGQNPGERYWRVPVYDD